MQRLSHLCAGEYPARNPRVQGDKLRIDKGIQYLASLLAFACLGNQPSNSKVERIGLLDNEAGSGLWIGFRNLDVLSVLDVDMADVRGIYRNECE